MFSKSLVKHFRGFGSGFTELHAKLDADTLLDFAIHHRRNEIRSQKSIRVKTMRVHSVVLRGTLMQQACGSVTLASPLIFFHQGSYNNNSPGSAKHVSKKFISHVCSHCHSSCESIFASFLLLY
jgi:hypothetical protein